MENSYQPTSTTSGILDSKHGSAAVSKRLNTLAASLSPHEAMAAGPTSLGVPQSDGSLVMSPISDEGKEEKPRSRSPS